MLPFCLFALALTLVDGVAPRKLSILASRQTVGTLDLADPIDAKAAVAPPPKTAKTAKTAKCPNLPAGFSGPPLNGQGHGQSQTTWGTARSSNGRYIPSTATDVFVDTRPNPRSISNSLSAQTRPATNSRGLSASVWWMGQLLDHDIALSLDGTADSEKVSIPVNVVDSQFTGPIVIGRSQHIYNFNATTGERRRVAVNELTHFIDASHVYGADGQIRHEVIRENAGGRLLSQFNSHGEFAPFNTRGVDQVGGNDPKLYAFGEFRGNEHAVLAAAQTLWLRNHNYYARSFASCNPLWGDAQIFEAARRMNVAEWQSVVYEDFLPALLGPNAVPAARRDATVDPRLYAEIAAAGYRVGHTLVNDIIPLFNETTGCPIKDLHIAQTFSDPSEVVNNGMDHIILGVTRQQANEVDNEVADILRNQLFEGVAFAPFPHPILDLVSINIARGREQGIPDFTDIRKRFIGSGLTQWSDLTSNATTITRLKAAYGETGWNIVDPFIGFITEDHAPGASVGPTLRAALADQFARFRNGDSFYYEFDSSLDAATIKQIKQTRLRDIILRNTNINQALLTTGSVFFVDPSVPSKLAGASCPA